MARGQPHKDETKAAVMAALLAGQGVNEVARVFKLSPSLVSGWKKEIPELQIEQVRTQKERNFGEMLAIYLEANFHALTQQAKVAADENYIKAQPASELATLHGVMADKGIRLLEAAHAAAAVEDG